MTCQELLQMIEDRLSAQDKLDIKMTAIHKDGDKSVARLMCPIDGKIQVIEIQAKELCVWDGLKIS